MYITHNKRVDWKNKLTVPWCMCFFFVFCFLFWNSTLVRYFPPLYPSTTTTLHAACCLLCASFVRRLGLDLAAVVSSNNVDISQTKRWSDTGSYSWWFAGKQIVKKKRETESERERRVTANTHTHARRCKYTHKCSRFTKVFLPWLFAASREQRGGKK